MRIDVTAAFRSDGSCVYVGRVYAHDGVVVAELSRGTEDDAYSAAFSAAFDLAYPPDGSQESHATR